MFGRRCGRHNAAVAIVKISPGAERLFAKGRGGSDLNRMVVLVGE